MTNDQTKAIVELTKLSIPKENFKVRITLSQIIGEHMRKIFRDGYVFYLKRHYPELYEAIKVLAKHSKMDYREYIEEVYFLNCPFTASFQDKADLAGQLRYYSKDNRVVTDLHIKDTDLFLLIQKKAIMLGLTAQQFVFQECQGISLEISKDFFNPTPKNLVFFCAKRIEKGQTITKNNLQPHIFIQIVKLGLAQKMSFDEWIENFPKKLVNHEQNGCYIYWTENKSIKECLKRFNKFFKNNQLADNLGDNSTEVLETLLDMIKIQKKLMISPRIFFSSFETNFPFLGENFEFANSLIDAKTISLIKKKIQSVNSNSQIHIELPKLTEKEDPPMIDSASESENELTLNYQMAKLFGFKRKTKGVPSPIAKNQNKNYEYAQKNAVCKMILKKYPAGFFTNLDSTVGLVNHNAIQKWATEENLTCAEWLLKHFDVCYVFGATFSAYRDLSIVQNFVEQFPERNWGSEIPDVYRRLSKYVANLNYANQTNLELNEWITEQIGITPLSYEDVVWNKRESILKKLYKSGPVVDLKSKAPDLYDEIWAAVYTDRAREKNVTSYADYIKVFHNREVIVDKRANKERKETYIEELKKELDELLGENGVSDGISNGKYGEKGIELSKKISYVSRSMGKSPNSLYELLGHPKTNPNQISIKAEEKYNNPDDYENKIIRELLSIYPDRIIHKGFSIMPTYFKIAAIARSKGISVKEYLKSKRFEYESGYNKSLQRFNTTKIEELEEKIEELEKKPFIEEDISVLFSKSGLPDELK